MPFCPSGSVSIIRRTLACLALVLFALAVRPAAAQQEDYETLVVRDHEINRELAEAGVELYIETLRTLEGYEEQAESGSIGRVNPDTVGKVHVGTQQLFRIADQLILLGEPGGDRSTISRQRVEEPL